LTSTPVTYRKEGDSRSEARSTLPSLGQAIEVFNKLLQKAGVEFIEPGKTTKG
jgi:hypothetical protein